MPSLCKKAVSTFILVVFGLSFYDSRESISAGQVGAMRLSSTVVQPNGAIPKKFTCDGPDLSPPLRWSEPPAGTKSFALIMDDPDAPMGTWVHWVIYDLPPTARALDENMPRQNEVSNGARQGRNDFRNVGYGGPCPPPGPEHRYFFKLYALDARLNLKSGATKADVEKATKGHVLGEAQLMGRYGRGR